ncbi:MAG TPA: SRPBCC family protein [Segetibacter sp.]|nr:SRPBCC family protein [Segetibacter sp.]
MNTNSSTGAKLSVNVGKLERIASILAGSALLVKGLQNEEKKSGIAMAIAGGLLFFRGATGHSIIYTIAGKKKLPDTVKNINIMTKLTVNSPRQEVYNFWRKLSNLPLFMEHLDKVEVIDSKRSHWSAKVPGHLGKIEWDAEIVKEIDGELLGWNSLPHASINNAGKVEFRDADENGTEITVLITYRAPFGDVGEGIASMLNPVFKKMITKDVKNFKRYIEAGDIATIES